MSCDTRRTGAAWVWPSSVRRRERRSQPGSHSSYSLACLRKLSRFSFFDSTPPASTISVRQLTSGSRLTSVAARSQLSSEARNHSSSAYLTAISGSPAIIGIPRRLSCRRIISAVRYFTCSERMWPASWPSTVRSSCSSSSSTARELISTIGRSAPIAAALAIGNCVR